MNKNDFAHGCLYVHKKEESKKADYTIRYIVFNPKKFFVGTDIAKDVWRRIMHCSKKKMNEEYDSIYGVWMKIGRGKNTHVEFNRTTKTAANVIFIVPKAHKRHANTVLSSLELPYDKTIFH